MRAYNFEKISTNGITLRVVVEGEGPLCILVHGWPESWYSWRHQIDPLVAAGYRVAVPDVRGYGGSDKPKLIEAYDMISLTGDVAGLIKALGEEEAILVGHDWGAPIVWTTALRYASNVRAVIGLSVPYLGRGTRPMIETFREIYKDRFFYQIYFQEPGVAEAELETNLAASFRKIYYSASGDISLEDRGLTSNKSVDAKFLDSLPDPAPLLSWLSEEDIAYYVGEFEQSGFRGPLNRYRNYERDWESLSDLSEKKIEQPAFFIAGSRDPVLDFIPGKKLHDRMDFSYTNLKGKVIIEGGGHWIQQERPEETNQALLDFLASCEN